MSGLAHASRAPAAGSQSDSGPVTGSDSAPVTGPALDNRRVAAAILDLAVVAAVMGLLAQLAGGLTVGVEAVAVAWGLYYYFALESGGGQTLGKRLLRLKVVGESGEQPGIERIAVRTLLRLVDGVGLYLVGLVVMLATGQRRQRLGDIVARTVVTTADSPAPAPEETQVAGDIPVAEEPPPGEEPPPAEDHLPPAEDHLPPAADHLPPAADHLPPAEDHLPPAAEIAPVVQEPMPPQQPTAEEPGPDPSAPEPESPEPGLPADEPEAPAFHSAAGGPAEAEDPEEPEADEGADDPDEAVPVKAMEIVSPIDLIMAESGDGARPEQSGERAERPDGEQPAV